MEEEDDVVSPPIFGLAGAAVGPGTAAGAVGSSVGQSGAERLQQACLDRGGEGGEKRAREAPTVIVLLMIVTTTIVLMKTVSNCTGLHCTAQPHRTSCT